MATEASTVVRCEELSSVFLENFKSFFMECYEIDYLLDTAEDPKEIQLKIGTKLCDVILALEEYFNEYKERKIIIEEDTSDASQRDCTIKAIEDEDS